MNYPTLSSHREIVLIVLQSYQVLFLAIHDWIQIGRFNDVSAVKNQDTRSRLIGVTILQTLPFAFGLAQSATHYGRPYPDWLMQWLFISYLILLIGQLRAWWLPYLLRPEPRRAERYRIMFARTYSFLPEHNGISPNTAHVLLHLATLITLCVLIVP